MLKITRIAEVEGAVLLKLEGRLLGPWVEELTRVCAETPLAARPLRLDLSAVTFLDGAGVRLLRKLMGQGIQVSGCSGFIAELLRREDR
jgi:anti-anti-sigma regulatory factor